MQGVRNSGSETLDISGILEDSPSDPIERALFTSYYVDEEWLLSYINPLAELAIIAQHTVNAVSGDNSRITRCFPEMPKADVQIMHTKIMLVYYRHRLRFVVLTGNLVKEDWSVMQNAVFVQDFWRNRAAVFRANEFSRSLAYALHDLGVPRDFVAMMNGVDFSLASARIVTSVPTGGVREQRNMDEYGVERLATVVRELGVDEENVGVSAQNIDEFTPNARLYCVGSSVGPMDNKWLCDMYLGAHGINHSQCKRPISPEVLPWDLVDIGVAFPTQKQADRCRYGEVGRQHVYMKRGCYFNKEFPRSSLVYLVPRVARTLVHAKVVLARFGVRQRRGWMYLGSHNFTPAAWGRLCVGGESRRDAYFNNYEFGVVLDNVEFMDVGENTESDVLWRGEKIALPFRYIWEPYKQDEMPFFSE
ncbi:hypothetical protein LPJ75_003158 [Coemansia sp. RSA 2598]|nr:hypothetical protein LPJ75_003158 [Coemansia sp. RSA 2598]